MPPARLSGFARGFDLPAAETVSGAEPLSGDDVLDVLSALVEKSLVMLEEGDAAGRYRMLETIRDYAGEKLAATSESADVAARHCEHYFAVGQGGEPRHDGPGPRRMDSVYRG